jgi:Ca2+-transporting ATPase
MITGDQPATAEAVARPAGLSGPIFIAAQTRSWTDRELAKRAEVGSVFARARPEDKLRIVRAASAAGEIVAVTGDGVNDAPALEAAALGVAMGRGGSDVAREAADLVLTDDNFATLTGAVAEGRRLYENVRKAVRYYLAVKLALIAVSLAVAAAGRPLPFSPVQIVAIELFVEIGASIAFVNQSPEVDVMRRRPRSRRARLLDRSMLAWILAGGVTLAVLTGVVFMAALPALGVNGARTLVLGSWLAGHASLGIVMAWERRGSSLVHLFDNLPMVTWATVALACAIVVLAAPAVQGALHAGPVPLAAALLTVAASLLAPWWLELVKRTGLG